MFLSVGKKLSAERGLLSLQKHNEPTPSPLRLQVHVGLNRDSCGGRVNCLLPPTLTHHEAISDREQRKPRASFSEAGDNGARWGRNVS